MMSRFNQFRSLESRTLATLRDTLLPRLLSGELRIPESEKMVEGY
jgi:type I restriction enzyme S subunit